VRRASPGQRAVLAERLAADLDAQERALAEGDVDAFVEMTVAFHRGFVEAGGTSVMLELYDRLADRQRFLLFDYGEGPLERRDAVITEHRELLERLCEDPVGFASVLHAHICETIGSPLTPL